MADFVSKIPTDLNAAVSKTSASDPNNSTLNAASYDSGNKTYTAQGLISDYQVDGDWKIPSFVKDVVGKNATDIANITKVVNPDMSSADVHSYIANNMPGYEFDENDVLRLKDFNPAPAVHRSTPSQPAPADATLYNVDPTTQTVQGQMNGLLDSNSQYMQLARQGAKEQANQAGLLNSTLAGTAGERAAIESAMPIAQQDAQTYFSQANLNQNAENNFKLFNTEFQYNDYFKDKDFNNQIALNSQQNQAAMDLQKLQDTGASNRLTQQIDADKFISEANNSIELQKLAQSSDKTFSEVTGKIDQQYLDGVKTVMNNATLTEDSKKNEIADLQTLRNKSIVLQSKLFGVDIDVYEDLISNTEDSGSSSDGTLE